jgi:hypothetical protein
LSGSRGAPAGGTSTTDSTDQEGSDLPNQPLLKLCLTCDQISIVRATSRAPRCSAPVPPAGKPCRSRQVQLITIAELNAARALDRAALTDLRTRLSNLESRHDELAEIVEELRRRR